MMSGYATVPGTVSLCTMNACNSPPAPPSPPPLPTPPPQPSMNTAAVPAGPTSSAGALSARLGCVLSAAAMVFMMSA